MNWDQVAAEFSARKSFDEFVALAEVCNERFTLAGLVAPDVVRQVLADRRAATALPQVREVSRGDAGSAVVPPIMRSRKPTDCGDGWICVELRQATAATVALAIIRDAGGLMSVSELLSRISTTHPLTTKRTMWNMAAKLARRVIDRTNAGWRLPEPLAVPVICDGYLWGPPSVFMKTEVAIHRREAIVHVLGYFPEGLRLPQLAQQLIKFKWVGAPISRDALAADIESLESAGKLHLRLETKTWEVTATGSPHRQDGAVEVRTQRDRAKTET